MAEPEYLDTADFEEQNERATRMAREADRIEPRARGVRYDPEQGLVFVELRSGYAFGFPPERIPGLEKASPGELSRVRISPSGDGLHWDELEVHASLTGLMVAALKLRKWAPRIMGQIRSEAKARAARANGLKGGRPRNSEKAKPREK